MDVMMSWLKKSIKMGRGSAFIYESRCRHSVL